jgi:hypothetical protein
MPTSEEIFHVKLGVPVSNYFYDDQKKRLFVAGIAIEQGVWTGMDGIPRYFPAEVLQASSLLFNGVPLVCEHQGKIIGNVVQVERTALGFRIKEAYITDPASIQSVLSGKKTGFSIEAAISIDPVRSIVSHVTKAINISLVADPACRICGITDAYLVKNAQGKKNMTEEITEVTTETSASPEVIQEATTEEQVVVAQETAPVTENTNSIFEELKLAASKFKEIQRKMTEALIGYDLSSIEPTTENVELSSEQTEVPVVESTTEESIVTEKPIEVVEEKPAVEVQEIADTTIDEAVTERFAELENNLVSVTEMVSEMVNQFETIGDQLIGLSAQIKILNEEKIALSEQTETERADLISQIKELDPDTDDNLIGDMTVTQLSSYKKKVETWRKPAAGGERKSVPQDKTASNPETVTVNRFDLINGIISELKNKSI